MFTLKQHILIVFISMYCLHICNSFQSNIKRNRLNSIILKNLPKNTQSFSTCNPLTEKTFNQKNLYKNSINILSLSSILFTSISKSYGIDIIESTKESTQQVQGVSIDWNDYKLPYNHENIKLKQFLGEKATLIFNMKIDDPQTVNQFPAILEIYKKYKLQGLNVLCFPTEQGWFEPDDDETCRQKALVYYGFGDYPNAVVFDKIDLLGPSAHPLYSTLTKFLPTPNGYSRITLNYEKFLLDKNGIPMRRYPRKYSAYDMEDDIIALLNDQSLPDETSLYQKAWREAKRESIKSEYAFRYNYNYYDAPDSMYKYDPVKDKL